MIRGKKPAKKICDIIIFSRVSDRGATGMVTFRYKTLLDIVTYVDKSLLEWLEFLSDENKSNNFIVNFLKNVQKSTFDDMNGPRRTVGQQI